MGKKKTPDIENLEEFLKEEYVNNKRSSSDIAEELSVSEWWVVDKLKKFKLPVHKRGGGLKTIDIEGERFGKYVVIDRAERIDSKNGARWTVLCDCGNVRNVQSSALRLGIATSCGKCKTHYAWKGVGQLSGNYFTRLKKGAIKRNIEFDVTKEQLWELFELQQGRCALSGVEIRLVRDAGGRGGYSQSASLDRIESSKGYVMGNIQWVHKFVNIIKWNIPEDNFIDWCRRISEHTKDRMIDI